MDENLVITAIDDEIGRLQQVRALLAGIEEPAAVTEQATPTQEAVGPAEPEPSSPQAHG